MQNYIKKSFIKSSLKLNDDLIKAIFIYRNFFKNKENIVHLPENYKIIIDFYDIINKIDINLYHKKDLIAVSKIRLKEYKPIVDEIFECKWEKYEITKYEKNFPIPDDFSKVLNSCLETFLLKGFSEKFNKNYRSFNSFIKDFKSEKSKREKEIENYIGKKNLDNFATVLTFKKEILQEDNINMKKNNLLAVFNKYPFIIKDTKNISVFEIELRITDKKTFIIFNTLDPFINLDLKTIKRFILNITDTDYSRSRKQVNTLSSEIMKKRSYKVFFDNFYHFFQKEIKDNMNKEKSIKSLENFNIVTKIKPIPITYIYNKNKNLLLKRDVCGDIFINFTKDIEENEELIYSIDKFIKEFKEYYYGWKIY